jgi:RNA polymerase sigma-70 factor (ECF subfamily)
MSDEAEMMVTASERNVLRTLAAVAEARPVAWDDRELGEAFRGGQRSVWTVVVARYGPPLQRLISQLLVDRTGADDVLQDVFAAAWLRQRQYRGDAGLRTWLSRIAINRCRARNRQLAWRRRLWERWWSLTGNRSAHARGNEEPVDRQMIERESARAIRQAVENLSDANREVIVLHYLEELSCAEIGRMLGLREATVRVRLNRARRSLAPALYPLSEENHCGG